MTFKVVASLGSARCGRLSLAHGMVETPAFMPVGTYAAVKGMTPALLHENGAHIILANAWHLMLRPGIEVIEAHGGLHAFMKWDKPILTDSGGYQIFSLASMCSLSEEGVAFRSPIDGSQVWMDAERSLQVQNVLGADIVMVFDECTPYPVSHAQARASMRRSMRWAERSRNEHARRRHSSLLFAIVQGGVYHDLRLESAEHLLQLDFPGYALGGLAVGESKQERKEVLRATIPCMPSDKPRYLMGLGRPEELIEAVALGVDLFDCVIPTRHARNGFLYSRHGVLRLRNAAYRTDLRSIDEHCRCYTCRHFTRSYLYHLDKNKEPLGIVLNTIHNLHYYLDLMARIRAAISAGTFEANRFDL